VGLHANLHPVYTQHKPYSERDTPGLVYTSFKSASIDHINNIQAHIQFLMGNAYVGDGRDRILDSSLTSLAAKCVYIYI
jgi:hypothetical protein